MNKHRDSIDRAILERILSQGPGRVHTPADFLDLGSRAAVDQALSRNARAGLLRRAGRGLYDLPHAHRIWGAIASPADALVEAVARRDKLTLRRLDAAPGPPVTAVFLTDGHSRRIRHGKGDILLKHASPRTLAAASHPAGNPPGERGRKAPVRGPKAPVQGRIAAPRDNS